LPRSYPASSPIYKQKARSAAARHGSVQVGMSGVGADLVDARHGGSRGFQASSEVALRLLCAFACQRRTTTGEKTHRTARHSQHL